MTRTTETKSVIIFTDGDQTAYRALKEAGDELGLYVLSQSRGNPTPLGGSELIEAVLNAPAEPVVVMADDRGKTGKGAGERAVETLLHDARINVLGVIAVAANTRPVHGVRVDASVTQDAEVVETAVDKQGHPTSDDRLKGDTVDVLDEYSGPIIGLGDPGKMEGHDAIGHGVPVTKEALKEVLQHALHQMS
ncbi:stage V sporulation protein AE [Sulfobacillus acidophilus DSM 10332]|uniref:Stage V sporulation protein AE n=1 Tax=Sulfobacillus acidophilus (strain ATCC 700253 / DSM 10332 / NAL) TaxID=679936 RepID=G8U026_SULAD|nr:stage V sporulation protein AE [Sulfobacillus acidophilus DSM 10332]